MIKGLKSSASGDWHQYRGEGWPLLGDFAVGMIRQDGSDWGFDIYAVDADGLTDFEVSTPFGGLYVWFRGW